jgi:hypothetical protein
LNLPFGWAQGGESFDSSQDRESIDVAQNREPVERPAERLVEPFRVSIFEFRISMLLQNGLNTVLFPIAIFHCTICETGY